MEGCCQVEQGTCKAPEPPPGSDDAPARGHKRKKNANLCCGSRPTLSVAPSPTATRMVAISLLLAGTGAAPPMQCDTEITIPLCTFCHDDFLRKAGAAPQPAVPAMQNRAEHDGRRAGSYALPMNGGTAKDYNPKAAVAETKCRSKPFANIQLQQQKRRLDAASTAFLQQLEPNGHANMEVVELGVTRLYKMTTALEGGGVHFTLDAMTMAELQYPLSRNASRAQRATFAKKGYIVASEQLTLAARDELRKEKAPPTYWLFPEDSPMRTDGATFKIDEAVIKYVEMRDPKSSWFEDEERLLLVLTNDGTNHGTAVQHSLQGGTFRVLNQREGTRSSDSTIVFSLARCSETKEEMAPVLAAQRRDCERMVKDGVAINGIKRDVIISNTPRVPLTHALTTLSSASSTDRTTGGQRVSMLGQTWAIRSSSTMTPPRVTLTTRGVGRRWRRLRWRRRWRRGADSRIRLLDRIEMHLH